VRRYVYNDVVRLDDLEKLIDCSFVQVGAAAVDHIMLRGEDLSSVLFRFDESDFTVSNLECLRVEGADPVDEDRNSSGGGGRRGKHKSGGGFFPQMALSLSNRRKGAPHRSPLS
ncbi:hypothetical protein BHM03_00042321, partial [Ensete ventricosum]